MERFRRLASELGLKLHSEGDFRPEQIPKLYGEIIRRGSGITPVGDSRHPLVSISNFSRDFASEQAARKFSEEYRGVIEKEAAEMSVRSGRSAAIIPAVVGSGFHLMVLRGGARREKA